MRGEIFSPNRLIFKRQHCPVCANGWPFCLTDSSLAADGISATPPDSSHLHVHKYTGACAAPVHIHRQQRGAKLSASVGRGDAGPRAPIVCDAVTRCWLPQITLITADWTVELSISLCCLHFLWTAPSYPPPVPSSAASSTFCCFTSRDKKVRKLVGKKTKSIKKNGLWVDWQKMAAH